MGFGISVLYFVTYYLTPTTVFGPLAVVRIQLILAALAFIVSLPALIKSFALKIPQSLALIGLALAVFLSVLIGMHWVGGARDAFLGFIPNAFAFFLVCLHCNSKKKLQVLVLMLLFVCLFVIAHGSFDLLHGVPESNPAPGVALGDPLSTGATASPYVLRQFTDADQWIYRLRG